MNIMGAVTYFFLSRTCFILPKPWDKELHPCLRDLANARIREADSQNMAGSCLVRKKFEFSGLVCSRLGVFNLII